MRMNLEAKAEVTTAGNKEENTFEEQGLGG
jgi:hypothetical protein